jgi:lipopolysaccharide biosynthesis regulator YciM
MLDLLWFLLPVAAASGWWAAKRDYTGSEQARTSSAEYVKGLNYLLDDKPDQAIEVFVRMVEVDRDTAETHLALGNLFRRRGEVDRAIPIHRNLIARTALTSEQRSRAMLELGEDYMRAGLFDRAETLFRELVEQPEHMAVALARLVDIYEQEKDWRQAIAHCDRLEKMTSQSRKVETAHYCCELAEEALRRNESGEAQELLRQALVRDPNCARASMLRGRMAMTDSNYAAAIVAFQAVEHQSRSYFSEIIPPLGQCHGALGRQAELIEYLRDVQGRDHTGRVTDALAELLLQQEGEEVVMLFLETELQNYPTLLGMRRLVELKLARSQGANHSDLDTLYRISRHLLDGTARYKCDNCGFVGKFLHWRCPSCKKWSSVKPIPDLVIRNNT